MSNPVDVPQASTSTSSGSSSPISGSPPPQLDPSTLALLTSFYQEREQAEQEFRDLEEKAHKRLLKAKEADGQGEGSRTGETGGEEEEEGMMTVERFRTLFGENWNLSQFW